MRSLLSRLSAREIGVRRSDLVRGRPEALRRATLELNSRLILAVGTTAMPFALYGLIGGALMPFVLSMLAIGTGFLTLALHRRGQFERAAFGQVYGILLAGLVLTIVDPQIVDFGLALSLLAPVQASLLTRSPTKKQSWVLLLAVVTIGCLGALGLVAWPEPARPEYAWIAAGAFVVTALVVALTAARLSSAFAVYERSQMSAYRHLVENVQDAVMRFTGDGTVLFTSRSAEKLFGCHRYELSGSGLIDRIHVLDRPTYMKSFSDASHDGKSRTIEVRMRRDDPAEPARVPQFIWIEIALTPVVEPDAALPRHEVVALLRNVSERHALEAEMREARRLAEDSSNAKSRFLATIGHELRTPLNAIVGFSEMMTSGVVGELSPAHREYAEIIHRSGHHLLDVVRMLLDMSRLEAGKFEIQTESFEPQSLIDPCFKIVGQLAKERGVELMTEVPRNLPALVGDERACRQILINLLSNAIKFSHDKGTVTVSMRRQNAMLAIAVSDQGIGMDQDAIRRIGEPFFQAQDGLSRRYEGTGLGLSIVKGLIDLHEGALRATSEPGKGTTVTVLLPINGPATKTAQTPIITELAPEPPATAVEQWQGDKKRA
jgi:cell cycle sensor histidine kinase DivJ